MASEQVCARDIHVDSPETLIGINRVGVSGLDFPINLRRRNGEIITASAVFDMFGSLLKERKGIDMSRFTETLMEWMGKPLSGENFEELLRQLQVKVRADDVFISSKFKYFVEKQSPVTNLKQWMAYRCRFIGIVLKSKFSFFEEVEVPITSVCPCSRNMSVAQNLSRENLEKAFGPDFKLDDLAWSYFKNTLADAGNLLGMGAHNQRGTVTIQVKCNPEAIWLEDLIEVANKSGSCEVYSLLKRPDEKYVTEAAYNNPRFVEDIAREAARRLMDNKLDIQWFRVRVENFESIHNHSATCYIERTKRGTSWYKTDKGLV